MLSSWIQYNSPSIIIFLPRISFGRFRLSKFKMFFEYTSTVSWPLTTYLAFPPPSDVFTIKSLIKFSSPKISSQISFRFACSLSSILIKITPSSLSNSRAKTRRGYIKVSQAEWVLLPRISIIRSASSSSIPILLLKVAESNLKLSG